MDIIILVEENKYYKQKYEELQQTCKELENRNKELEERINKYTTNTEKGKMCSVNGGNYKKKIYDIVKKCSINDKKFNTQNEKELGGSSSINDLDCNYIIDKDIGIEAKICNTPDWMQCSIKYNNNTKKWEGSKKGKIPTKSRDLFDKLINNIKIFDNEIPPFMKKNITHEEWISIKQNTDKWNDQYLDVPKDTIRKLYYAKGCKYIQISNYGLYHIGKDVCNFNVPIFDIEQQIRIRTKIHSKKNKKGFCNLSVTIACQPKNIKLFAKSPYSIDNKDTLPTNLIYNSNQ
jgi:exonuclease VII small subunit